MRKKLALGLILVMLFSLFPQLLVFSLGSEAALAAGTSLATLEEVKGGVFVKKGGGAKEFKGIKGMALAQGDSVRTDKEGSTTLAFSTGSKMSVGPSTLFTVSKVNETKDSGGKISIKLKSGSLWNKVKSLLNIEDEYEIETPTTVMGVRGTLFLVSVDPASGETVGSVMEGAVGAQQNTLRNMGQQEQLVLMGNSIQVPPYQQQYSMPQPPPPPAPIDMNNIIGREDPSILANIAVDIVDRMQELQQQSQSYLSGYKNTNNQAYLQGALQFSQMNTLLADLSQQYMNAVQGTAQEQQMNQILEQQNRNTEALRQQVQQLTDQVQQMRNNSVEAAQQAGIDPDRIQRLLQNATTASASAGAGTGSSPVPPPPVTPPAPPVTGGGDDDDEGSEPGNEPERIELTSIGSIAGTAKVGVELVAGALEPANATVTYQWMRADAEDGEYVDIAEANANTYNLVTADENKFIIVKAIGTGNFTGTVVSAATEKVAGPDPLPAPVGPQAASPGVVLIKNTATVEDPQPDSYQAGDKFEFRFDRPVKASPDLTDIKVWEEAFRNAESEGSFGEDTVVAYNDEDKDGFVESFFIELVEGFKLPISGQTFSIPYDYVKYMEGGEEKTATADIEFTLPILNVPKTYEVSTITNFTMNGISEYIKGSYGIYKSIPQGFGIQGLFDFGGISELVSNGDVRLTVALWYYNDNYERQFITPNGVQSNEIRSEDQLKVDITSLMAGYDHYLDSYTWQVKLTEEMIDSISALVKSRETQDFHVQLAVEVPYDEYGYSNTFDSIVGGFTVDQKEPELLGYDFISNENGYALDLYFNEDLYFTNPTEQIMSGLSLTVMEQNNVDIKITDAYYDYLRRRVQIKFDSTSDLNNLPYLSMLQVSTIGDMLKDPASNVANIELNLFKHKQAYLGEGLGLYEMLNPIMHVGNNTTGSSIIVNTEEPIKINGELLKENDDVSGFFYVEDLDVQVAAKVVENVNTAEKSGGVIDIMVPSSEKLIPGMVLCYQPNDSEGKKLTGSEYPFATIVRVPSKEQNVLAMYTGSNNWVYDPLDFEINREEFGSPNFSYDYEKSQVKIDLILYPHGMLNVEGTTDLRKYFKLYYPLRLDIYDSVAQTLMLPVPIAIEGAHLVKDQGIEQISLALDLYAMLIEPYLGIETTEFIKLMRFNNRLFRLEPSLFNLAVPR